jgi:sugar-specific transcriptional regulator TrmB
MADATDPEELLARLDLKEYEARALATLLEVGRTTAPNLAEATGIPKARIYGVLDALADMGFVEVIPGRPKEYQPKAPADVLDRATENYRREFERRRQEVEELREEFLATFEPRYERATEDVTPTEELFYVVDVGDPSERETRRLYEEADERVHVVTKSFEYLDAVAPALADALDRGIEVRALFLHPDRLTEDNREKQVDLVARLHAEFPAVETRFSEGQLPWRGTIADPSMDYETGEAVFLVEETDVPLHMRQAAVTENGSLVAGMQRYFELTWEYESVGEYPG